MTSCTVTKNASAKIEKVRIAYKGKHVSARKLMVESALPIELDKAWEKVQTSSILKLVAAGKVTFRPTEGRFLIRWKEGDTVTTKMLF